MHYFTQGLIFGALAVLFLRLISSRDRSDQARNVLRDLSARSSARTNGATDCAFSTADRILETATERLERALTAFNQTRIEEERSLHEELAQAQRSGRLAR